MRFFGGREQQEDPRVVAADVEERLRALPALAAGPVRHGALAGALVRAGELAQGIADAAPGTDAERVTLEAVAELARSLWSSWRAGGNGEPPSAGLLAPLRGVALPDSVVVRPPEGFTYYAVYPEGHAAAAEALARADPLVLGIRSIGTTLGAMVASGAGVRGAFYTVRPQGPPFSRDVTLPASLAAIAGARREPVVAIADEGPGLSGSSMAAAIEAFERLGIPDERIHLFPSHAGAPGPQASDAVRARWARAPKHLVPFEQLFLRAAPLALERLAEDAIGAAESAPEDLGAGAWRGRLFPQPTSWPPTEGWRERRKYLVRAGGKPWLAKFAGIGAEGERKLARARVLAAEGFVPEPAALRYGFLFEPWLEGAVPLPRTAVRREVLLGTLRRYLAFIAARFPAGPGAGATPAALLEMARVNAGEGLGPEAVRAMRPLEDDLPEVEREARPVEADAKLQPWEWLVRPGGALVKTDALDHHVGHDLAGAQDALWDVAGAEVELGLGAGDARSLAEAVRAAAAGASPRFLPFYRVCYCALQVGRWGTALLEPGHGGGAETARKRVALGRYSAALRREIGALAKARRPP